MDRVQSNSSLNVTRVSAGSPIETTQSQSPELIEAPEKVTSNTETAPVQAMLSMVCNSVPKTTSEETGPLDFSRGVYLLLTIKPF